MLAMIQACLLTMLSLAAGEIQTCVEHSAVVGLDFHVAGMNLFENWKYWAEVERSCNVIAVVGGFGWCTAESPDAEKVQQP